MAVIAVCAVPVVLVSGLGHVTGEVVLAAVVTGVVCSALAFTLQLWGQRYVEPSRAAVILLFEPVVAGFVGFLVGERLGVKGYLGALVIFVGIVHRRVEVVAVPGRPSTRPAAKRWGNPARPLDRAVKRP